MHRFKQLTLFLGDLVALCFGLYGAVGLRYLRWPGNEIGGLFFSILPLFLVAALILFIIGLYDIGRAKNTWDFYRKIIISAGIWMVLGVIYFYVNPRTNVTPKTILLLTTVLGFGLIALWRFLYNHFLSTTIWKINVIFAGITPEVIELMELINNQPSRGFTVMGCLNETGQPATLPFSTPPAFPIATTLSELAEQMAGRQPDLIVVAPSLAGNANLQKELYHALFKQTSMVSLDKFYEQTFRRVPPFTFSEAWFVTNLQEQNKKIYDRFRVLIDYWFAVLMGIILIVTLPILVVIIKLTSPGPIFFKQKRVGRLGKEFTIYKYRTMQALAADGSAETAGPQWAALKDKRITAAGRVLRRARLDELPQFLNILKGEMALIGPRPERPEFVAELTNQMPFYSLRHLIKPGLTGWAQLQKSYYGDIEDNLHKLEYDLYYLKNRGAILDLAIVLRTFNVLAKMMGR